MKFSLPMTHNCRTLFKVRKIRRSLWSSSETMQETIRLQQMGRQNMIPRKIRLFETDYSPKERKISNTAKPKSHLWLSFISTLRYRVILVQHTSKTVTSIRDPNTGPIRLVLNQSVLVRGSLTSILLILWVAGETTPYPIPIFDQTTWSDARVPFAEHRTSVRGYLPVSADINWWLMIREKTLKTQILISLL